MIPIIVKGNTAIIDVNPDAPLVTYMDKWYSHGYLASLGQVGEGRYGVKQVTYNLNKVSLKRVQDIANKFDTGAFSCPVCKRRAAVAEQEPETTPKRPPGAPTPAQDEPPELDLGYPEFDDVFTDPKEPNGADAVEKLITMLDKLTLYGTVTG